MCDGAWEYSTYEAFEPTEAKRLSDKLESRVSPRGARIAEFSAFIALLTSICQRH
jgi:hypothetical protein